MRKFYLYAAIIISLFCAGFVMAARTDLFYFPEREQQKSSVAEESSEDPAGQNAAPLDDCPEVSIIWDQNDSKYHTAQTRCDKHTNGQLAIEISPAKGNYSVDWYKTSQLGDPDGLVGKGLMIDKLEAGSYTAEVKIIGTHCVFYQVANVKSEPLI